MRFVIIYIKNKVILLLIHLFILFEHLDIYFWYNLIMYPRLASTSLNSWYFCFQVSSPKTENKNYLLITLSIFTLRGSMNYILYYPSASTNCNINSGQLFFIYFLSLWLWNFNQVLLWVSVIYISRFLQGL